MGVAVEGLWLGLAKDPLAMSLMSAAGDMDVQPVDIINKICRIFLLPPYKATILCFSNLVCCNNCDM